MCRPGESLMRTPTLFKLLMCCMLLVVAGLALPTPAWTAPGGITDPGTEATATPTGDGIAAPSSDIDPQALVAPQALAEPDRLARMPLGPFHAPVSAPAPEPSALLLLAVGIGLLWLIRRKR